MKPSREALLTSALALVVALVGVGIWVVGLIAGGQYTEDLCFDDLDARSGYGSYHSEGTLFPPSFECRLDGSDAEPVVVQHRLVAVARFGMTVVFPMIYGLLAVFAVARWSRGRPPLPSEQAN